MRRHDWRQLVLLVMVLTVSLILAACGGGDDQADEDIGGNATTTVTVATEATVTVDSGGTPSTPGHDMHDMGTTASPTGDIDPDLQFIDAMIVHHGSAVAMAEVAQDVAEHEEITQLAGEIIEAQEQEIEQLMAWRDEWYPDAPESNLEAMTGMAGMNMSEADLEMLREATDFDKMFIDMMIPHHESAIVMAEALQDTTERPELQELVGNIIETQQAEIDQMHEWRQEWYGE